MRFRVNKFHNAGEQAASVFKPLYERFGFCIDFAWQTFKWGSESKEQAAVHCVIIGFSSNSKSAKKLFLNNTIVHSPKHINAYLLEAPDVFIESRNKPICNVPEVLKGSSPVDGGNLLLTDAEYHELIAKEPHAEKYIKKFCGAKEYLHNINRWCLWLKDITPADIICGDANIMMPDAALYHLAFCPLMCIWHGYVLYAAGSKAITGTRMTSYTIIFRGAAPLPNKNSP